MSPGFAALPSGTLSAQTTVGFINDYNPAQDALTCTPDGTGTAFAEVGSDRVADADGDDPGALGLDRVGREDAVLDLAETVEAPAALLRGAVVCRRAVGDHHDDVELVRRLGCGGKAPVPVRAAT